MSDEPFVLANPPAEQPKPDFTPDPKQQRVLLAGLDCEPGQLDLFDTDGEPE